MNINLRKHLKSELFIILITGIFMFTVGSDMHLFIKITGICCFVGFYNSIYLISKLLYKNNYNAVLIILIFTGLFGFLLFILSILMIPLLITEFTLVCTGKVTIGNN